MFLYFYQLIYNFFDLELWHVHLISSRGSTLFSLRSIGRKRFSRAIAKDEHTEQIKVDATGNF